MGSLADDGEVVEDRFDDQSFDDAPLSDRESNFDEMELRDCEQLHQPTDQIYSQNNCRIQPALSTIAEESRIEDVPSSEKASDIIQREQESFIRRHACFIPDDPRFNQSRFDKENSWEPSILEHSSFESTDQCKFAESLPVPSVPKLDGDHCLKSHEGYLNTDSNINVERNDATVHVIEALIAKATSRKRHNDLAEKFNALSVIMPEDSSISVERSIAETTASTNLSVGKIQSVLKGVPPSSSPRTLMKVLDEYKRSRVKARKAGDHPLPPPVANIEPSLSSCTSHHLPSHKACNSAGAMVGCPIAGDNLYKTTNVNNPILSEMVAKTCTTVAKPDIGVACKEVKAPCPLFPLRFYKSFVAVDTYVHNYDRRPENIHPRGLLHFTVHALMFLLSFNREGDGEGSVLYIPQLEVAFGFVAVGDTAISNVDVTNRTDNSVRIRARLSHSGLPFALLDSQILLLDAHRTVPLRIEFSPTQNARFSTYLLIAVEGGGGPQVNYRHVSVRLRSPMPTSNWRSSQTSLVSTASTAQQRGASELQVIIYWGEERTRLRLRCFENLKGISHLCEGIRFTDAFVGEDSTFCPPEDHPITKEDVRLFDQTLRMCTIYVCSPRIRPGPSLISNYSSPFERSLQPEDTFRERSTYKVAVPDLTLR
uniref:ASH domain-containing protein n=1 Tax=Angiostrongylus cantonensis TaxID=6313 RepID=A0A0K0CW33_ANGCA